MISLLPKDIQSQHRYTYRNRTLRNYLFLMIVVLITTLGLLFVTWHFISKTKADAEITHQKNIDSINKYTQDKADADAFSDNLTRAKAILNQKFAYSKVLFALAQTLPAEVSIESIRLDQGIFKDTQDLTIITNSTQKVVDTKQNLEKSNLFEQVSIRNINNQTENNKINATFSLSFNKEVIDEKN